MNETKPTRKLRVSAAYQRFALEQAIQFPLLALPPGDLNTAWPLTALVSEQNRKLEQALREGMACGEVRADIAPAAMATALWGMFNGVLTLGVRNDGFKLEGAAREKALERTRPN